MEVNLFFSMLKFEYFLLIIDLKPSYLPPSFLLIIKIQTHSFSIFLFLLISMLILTIKTTLHKLYNFRVVINFLLSSQTLESPMEGRIDLQLTPYTSTWNKGGFVFSLDSNIFNKVFDLTVRYMQVTLHTSSCF